MRTKINEMHHIFKNSYNREDYINFLKHYILPDDFEIITEKLENLDNAKYILSVTLIAKCKSLNLFILEIKTKSKRDARSGPLKETAKIMGKYSFRNVIIFSISNFMTNYRISLIVTSLNLHNRKVHKSYNSLREYSTMLGPKSLSYDIYKSFIDGGKINALNSLKEKFRNKFGKPCFRYWKYDFNIDRTNPQFRKGWKKNNKFENEDNKDLEINPFKEKLVYLLKDDNIEQFDDEYIIENDIKDDEYLFYRYAYLGYEDYAKFNYTYAIKNFEKAMNYVNEDDVYVYSFLAKCYFYVKDGDNFIKNILNIFIIDPELIKGEIEELIIEYRMNIDPDNYDYEDVYDIKKYLYSELQRFKKMYQFIPSKRLENKNDI